MNSTIRRGDKGERGARNPNSAKRAGNLALVALLGAVSCPSAGLADTSSEIKALKARLKELEAKVAHQSKESAQVKNALNSAKSAADHKAPPPVFVSFKNGLFVETEDKAFSFHIGGRVHVDGGFQGDPRVGDASNVLLRRARLDIQGKAFKHWYYRTQFEFGGGSGSASSANVRDAWLGYKGPILAALGLGYDRPFFIQLGNQLRPLGLEAMSTSNSGIQFIERTMMSDTFNTPRRHLGASISTGEHNWGAKLGLYSASPQDSALRPNRNGMGQYFEVAGRAVFLPIRTEEDMIHIGASGRYRSAGGSSAASDDELLLGRGPRNEANALNTRYMSTPDLSCNPGSTTLTGAALFFGSNQLGQQSCLKSQHGFNVEAVAIHGPFSVQAEYARTTFDFDSTKSLQLLATPGQLTSRLAAGQGLASSATFDGWYVQGAVFLTGETRITGYTDFDKNVNTPYTFSTAPHILHPLSKGGYGAFELAARFSALNANSGSQSAFSYLPVLVSSNAALAPATLAANTMGVTGGRVNKLTVGLNWYPEKGVRLLFNYGRILDNVAPYNQPFLSNASTSTFLTRAEVWW